MNYLLRDAVRSVAKNFGHRLGRFNVSKRVHSAKCARCGAGAGFVVSTPTEFRTAQVETPCQKKAA